MVSNDIYTLKPIKREEHIIIDSSLGNKLINASKGLVIYSGIIDGYIMIKRNMLEIENKIKFYEENWMREETDFRDVNRLMINFLSTLYFFINYCERKINPVFELVKKKYYDRYFEYRLFYHLRNYATHSNYSIVSVTHINKEEKNTFTINIKSSDLINNDVLSKKFKEEIKNLNVEDIVLNTYLKNFKRIIFDLLLEILILSKKEITDYFSLLMTNVQNRKEDRIDTFLCLNDEIILSLLKMPNKFLNSLYVDIINKDVDQEYKLNLYNNITTWFNSLQNIYFDE